MELWTSPCSRRMFSPQDLGTEVAGNPLSAVSLGSGQMPPPATRDLLLWSTPSASWQRFGEKIYFPLS